MSQAKLVQTTFDPASLCKLAGSKVCLNQLGSNKLRGGPIMLRPQRPQLRLELVTACGDHYALNRQRFVVPVPCQGNHLAFAEARRNRGRYRTAPEAQLLR